MIELVTVPGEIVARESTATVRVEGKGVWNPHHPHRVLILSDGSARLSAEATVIAKYPVKGDAAAGTVRIGDRLMVDGSEYEVRARPMSDPELVPASSPAEATGEQQA